MPQPGVLRVVEVLVDGERERITGRLDQEFVGDDLWEVGLRLSEGTYEYKFIVDGKHRLDPSNPEEVTAADGSVRSRVRVLTDGHVAHYGRWTPRREPIPSRVTFEPNGSTRLTLGGDYSYQRVDGSVLWLTAKYRTSYAYVPDTCPSNRWRESELPILNQR